MKRVILVGILLFIVGYFFNANRSFGYQNLNIEDLKDMVDDPAVYLVNVHIPYAGDIPGTDKSVPYNQIDSLDLPKNAKIVVYCRSGSMSEEAATRLVELGYTHIYNLQGGMTAWKAAGNELTV